MQINDMKVAELQNPLGIDETPYFSWKVIDADQNTVQSAYEIWMYDENRNTVWTSGKVESDRCAFIPYSGEKLESCMRYIWNVKIWDNNGKTAESSASFETAFLSPDLWKAKWILPNRKRQESRAGFGNQDPATLFRKKFILKDKPVKSRLYATCHGIYRLTVNGKRADNREFAPEHTSYGKYLCYQIYDLNDFLVRGENVLGMYVGDGWYLGAQTVPDIEDLIHEHAVLFQLQVQYPDGTNETICSDLKMQWADGPVVSSDLYAGELYDACREKEGWDIPASESDCMWGEVREETFGFDNLRAQAGQPVIPVLELPVKRIISGSKGETILDFGQVIAGKVRMRVHIPVGESIILEHCEMLDKDGNYTNHIYGGAGIGENCDQKDIYISSGRESVYEPMFTYHGFRYVKVTGLKEIRPEDFKAVVLSSDLVKANGFLCSDERLNKLYQNICWSQRSNMFSIPTDCPQREKAGWTGDILIYAKTALQNSNLTPFLSRGLDNLAAEQDVRGSVPFVVPFDGSYPKLGQNMGAAFGDSEAGNKNFKTTSAGWGDAAVMVPWSMYEITGNTKILEKQYASMKAWCDYIIRESHGKYNPNSNLSQEIQKKIWNTGFHYGEWLIPSLCRHDETQREDARISMTETTKYIVPIFGWMSVFHMAKVAEILKKHEDAVYYREQAEDMKDAIQNGGVIDQHGNVPAEFMGAYVLLLYFDLVPDKFREKYGQHLVELIENNNGCLDTGFLGTPYILDALCRSGYEEEAWKLLYQNKIPSWLYEVDNGATTIWESWIGYEENGDPRKISFNHYAFGCVADWMFRYVGGIWPMLPGYKKFRVRLRIDKGITYCERKFESQYGKIVLKWKVSEENVKVWLDVPFNTTAEIEFRDGSVKTVGCGHYEWNEF